MLRQSTKLKQIYKGKYKYFKGLNIGASVHVTDYVTMYDKPDILTNNSLCKSQVFGKDLLFRKYVHSLT